MYDASMRLKKNATQSNIILSKKKKTGEDTAVKP